MTISYQTQVTATSGRDGRAVAADGRLDVKLAIPKELGGPGGEATNPEQLFAAGYAACFLSALKFVASKAHRPLPADTTVTATVGIGPVPTGFALEVDLSVNAPGVATPVVHDLIERAHVVCPYSNATRGNIPVRISVK